MPILAARDKLIRSTPSRIQRISIDALISVARTEGIEYQRISQRLTKESPMAAAKKRTAKRVVTKTAAKKERKPRDNTKLMQAEALLRKSAGISIPDLGKELGWNGNTVRGVFARFRKD